MKTIKKILTLVLACLLSLSCFACGGAGTSSSESSSSSTEESSSSQESSSTSNQNPITSQGGAGLSSSSQQEITLSSLTLSGQTLTASSLSEVDKTVTVTGNFSDGSSKVLTQSEYSVFVEYASVSTAKVTVVHKGTGISSSYNVTLDNTTCVHAYAQTTFTEPTKTANGVREYTCEKCFDVFSQEIPMLNNSNYQVSSVAATTTNAGMDLYVSSVYGTYTIETAPKLDPSTGEEPTTINNGNLVYSQENISNVYVGTSSYPRLYELQDGTWICGFDTWGTGYDAGTIVVVRSTDKGKTWSKTLTRVSQHNTANCANVAFFQMDNGDILCGYRALGTSLEDPLSKALHVAISKDNGFTWSYHSTITDAYNLKGPDGTSYSKAAVQKAIQAEGRLGFFEPHFGVINGEIAVMYADDLTTWMENPRNIAMNQDGSYPSTYWKNYETQYIIKRTLSGTTWSDPKVVLDGTVQKTIGSDLNHTGRVTDYSRDGMPVFDKLSDGTYVLVVEGTYRDSIDAAGNTRPDTVAGGKHDFNIYLSYSKDGNNWSNPVEVYIPYTNNTKASAPYIVVTNDDRLIISFQTDQDCPHTGNPDGVSTMRTIISDGTPVDKITGPENFYEATNPYFAPPGSVYSWNGMMIDKDTNTLYCVSGTNCPSGAIALSSAKIPEYAPQNYYTTTASTDFNVKNGTFGKQANGYYRTTSNNTLLTTSDSLYNGEVSMDMYANNTADCGILFRVSATPATYWEGSGVSYYLALVCWDGYVRIGKTANGTWSTLWSTKIENFSCKNKYNLKVVLRDGLISCYLDGKGIAYVYDASTLTGTGVGVRSASANMVFTKPVVKAL